jgi:hypothetical protein
MLFNTILVERKCPFTGTLNTMQLPMTVAEYNSAFAKWEAGALIQNAFPTLNADQREFVKTGITPAVWDSMFGEAE